MTMGAAQKLRWHDPLHAEALRESSVGTTPCAQRRSPLLVILACLVPSIRKDPIDTNFRERRKSAVGTTSCLQRKLFSASPIPAGDARDAPLLVVR